ncbi:MAG: 7,8-didemethyl-8-hydroxy-5-deazariboflavin synthase subunit CofG [Nitrosopumilaceae archaeon]|nr:7,8-didemethyl-8-hydroxy-5-deazariboflavin synthase subunit CofG [Nitrosopumilaceae archaeon]NIU01586.1 7,8-didemethyl-8-hydroxy-5-deazariboflavin synthase subunit CofG [Nitrosopumilaceae archaeon]NIU88005.1 7,8-didemethyl-8-hydroxy-5-deazariboflavin synthase subunit CofG [Nitrosopumilaceae archaeon]NIV66272.1 7,8-didemethyl-8-hydroxy-5-deazariboflavin synthase subunit CofG [Nitrosopumilaceae archaeon]NIX62188.1 7,8-didemethyl-8-hydroxy-5-deazariboflavin synthase subunit CofG [Nitrosopumilac
MSELLFDSEILNGVLEGRDMSEGEALELFNTYGKSPQDLFRVSHHLKDKNKGKIVTFSKKAFFNVVNLCKDTCSYCTYKAEPTEAKLVMMSETEANELIQLAKKHRCTEALFVTGEKPELRYREANEWLYSMGFKDTTEYLIHLSEKALDSGLFPHTNAGNLTKKEMNELKKTNVSMGVMLENASERLTQKGHPHYLATSKKPKERIKVLNNAGELGFPITTGLLIGIGETIEEIIHSIFVIKEIHEKYGNIQEIILQNFQPKQDIIMKDQEPANELYFKLIVSLTRLVMPQMNIQIPPNLSPESYQSFLDIGINDWGGISPVTPDYVNPEHRWPEIKDVDNLTREAGYELGARFPIYPEFFSFLNKNLREQISKIEDENGLVKEEYWR